MTTSKQGSAQAANVVQFPAQEMPQDCHAILSHDGEALQQNGSEQHQKKPIKTGAKTKPKGVTVTHPIQAPKGACNTCSKSNDEKNIRLSDHHIAAEAFRRQPEEALPE